MSSQPETVASAAGDQIGSTFCCFVLYRHGSRVFLEIEQEVSALIQPHGSLFNRLFKNGEEEEEFA